MNEKLGATLALVNACLNGSAAICLFLGWRAIKAKNRRVHAWMMASAFTISVLFLISYVTRVLVSGTHRYPGTGPWKTIYLAVLMSHMLLAIATPPLAIRTLYLAVKKRFAEHRRLVRFTLPIWMYVSVTGVLVYVLLYHPPT
jgi:putative membrane protein